MKIFHIILYLLLIHLSDGNLCGHNILKIFLNFLHPFSDDPDLDVVYASDISPNNFISPYYYIPIQHYPISSRPVSTRRKSLHYDSYPTVMTRRASIPDSSRPVSTHRKPSYHKHHSDRKHHPYSSLRKHSKSRNRFHPRVPRRYGPFNRGLSSSVAPNVLHHRFATNRISSPAVSSPHFPARAMIPSTRSVPSPTVSTIFNPTTHKNWKLVNDVKCGSSSENRIVGGINATLGQYPWVARIGYSADKSDKNITFKCGGTLISKQHVVTAAHCTINLPDGFQVTQVRLGEYDTSKNVDCVAELCAAPHQDFEVELILVHRYYGEPRNANDIALIKLNNSVKFTEWIAPICLPFGSLLNKKLTGAKVDIAGWGYYDVTVPKGSTILQTVKLPVLPTNICSRKFRRYTISEKKQICVGGVVGKDSCNGDSGGPLMKVEVEGGEGPKYFLFGIVSFGATYCGLSTSPAVYTNVASYLKWILENMSLK